MPIRSVEMTIEKNVPIMFNPKEVARILNISRSQVYVLLKCGELGSVTIRGSRRISQNQMLDFINRLEGGEN
jgi:excisionase family DNA binding protein